MFFFEEQDFELDENEAIVNQKKKSIIILKSSEKKLTLVNFFLVNLNYIILKSTKHFNVSLKIKCSRTGFSSQPLSALESLLGKVIL